MPPTFCSIPISIRSGLRLRFNPCPIGWVVYAAKSISNPYGDFMDGGDSETWCNVSPPSDPNGYGFFFKPFQGTPGPPADLLSVYLYQDNPATPGTKFTLSGYAACEANYSGLITTNNPPSATLFVVEFLDNSGNIIQSNAYRFGRQRHAPIRGGQYGATDHPAIYRAC